MRAKIGCRLIVVLASIVFAAACTSVRGGAPTAEPSFSEAEPEAAVVVTATRETAATDSTATLSVEIDGLLEANQCLSCHVVGDRGNAAVGPSLNGLAARIDMYGLTQSTEAYVYESLVNPAAYLPANCPTGQCANIMPSYADRLSDDELNALVAFLLSLPAESP